MSQEERLTLESKRILESLQDVVSSISKLLTCIKGAVLAGSLNPENHIYDDSIWNNIGLFCLRNDMPNIAEMVYRSMLETLREYEKAKNVELYKGLALNNLGIALYLKNEYSEAKMKLREAADEDKVRYGSQASQKSKAMSALLGLSFRES